jgi:hypothetical protein
VDVGFFEEGTEPSTDVRQKGVVFSRCTRISAPASGVAIARAAANQGSGARLARTIDVRIWGGEMPMRRCNGVQKQEIQDEVPMTE